MPNIIHRIKTEYKETFRTAKVVGMFDVPVSEKLEKTWNINMPIEEKPWKLGLIVGSSGAGKTTIAKKIFGEENYHSGFEWPNDISFLEGFDRELNANEITKALNHVGFSSPPSWLLPFSALSNGQKFRAEIARILLDKKQLTVIDEFTSVIDRTVAKIGCAAISKLIKKMEKKIVAVSCHYDIKEWLEPDWIYDVNDNTFIWGSLRRPEITIEIFECHYKAWELFKNHHYLTGEISHAAKCFIAFYEKEPVAFSSYIHFVHPKKKKTKREHRTVVLPDYQGIGIGNELSNFVGDYCKKNGFNFISTTSHPNMIFSRLKNPKWKMTRKPSVIGANKNMHIKSSSGRLTASFEYIG